MTTINWYPGHMAKATRELKEQLKQIQLVIEVLDARIPYSSQNPTVANLISHKPRLVLLNKKDLADPDHTNRWITYLNQHSGVHTIAINSLKRSDMRSIIAYCESQLLLSKRTYKRLNVMIVGIPNVGKSQLINQLSGKKSAKVANRPAVTQRQQWVMLSPTVYLLDTPGVLWPKFDSQDVGINLAITGAIKDHIFNREDVAFQLLHELVKDYPTLLKNRFKLTQLPEDQVELMRYIGKQRGCIERGGGVDLEKTYHVLLHEYRSGKLGTITLEKQPG
jgi:ribosome biogenesis GTPase A